MHVLGNMLSTLLLIAVLTCISVTDVLRGIIPDKLNAALAAIGIVTGQLYGGSELISTLAAALSVMAVAFGISKSYHLIRRRNGLGLGDVKFLGAAACWIDIQNVPWIVLIASISGLSYVLLSRLIARDPGPTTSIPFGPHLSLGLAVLWLLR